MKNNEGQLLEECHYDEATYAVVNNKLFKLNPFISEFHHKSNTLNDGLHLTRRALRILDAIFYREVGLPEPKVYGFKHRSENSILYIAGNFNDYDICVDKHNVPQMSENMVAILIHKDDPKLKLVLDDEYRF